MLDAVLDTIARHRMFDPGRTVAVAVSGGADSVCLLPVLQDLAPRLGISLSVIHLDHAYPILELGCGCGIPVARRLALRIASIGRSVRLQPGSVNCRVP